MSPGEIAEGVSGILDTPYAVDFDKINSIGLVVSNISGAVLGFAAVFIVVFMTVMTTLDVLYLTIPIFRSLVREKNLDGSGGVKKFRLVSHDARLAVEQMAIEEGKVPIANYCLRRLKTYLICVAVFTIITVYQDQLVLGIRALVIKALEGTGII